MKKSILFVIITVLLFACKSPTALIEEGNYDKAIDKSIKKILKGKADDEDIYVLDQAYRLANIQNLERINFLKSEGRPESWEEIYFLYSALDNRQQIVRKVLPLKLKGKTLDYEETDYTSKIIEAKSRAAEYFYQNGKRLMGLNNKGSYREAYYNFNKAFTYGGSTYSDLEQLMADAKYLGTSRVLVDVNNSSQMRIPPDFFSNLLAINTSELNKNWTEYYLGRTDRNVEYDYYITVFVQNIIISPERIEQSEYERRKEVQDGFTYALDSKGNVKKDTLGNDIKVPRYKILRCTVMQRRMVKEATVEAQIEYMALYPNRRVIKLIPVGVTSVFENYTGRSRGDQGALLPEDLDLIRREPLPFPDDLSMVYNCSEPLKQAISNALRENNNLVN